ncbi:MAG: superinfection immunity protein [Dehalococcoidaceae bacterium]|nr:superinfection immunity protein [Dehalococcoidaceae bacterium]
MFEMLIQELLLTTHLAMRPPGPLEIGLILLIVFIIPVYFLPTIIALARHADNRLAIFLINLFLGWSLVGWVVALVLSFSKTNGIVQNGQTIIVSQNTGDNRGNSKEDGIKYCTKCGAKLGEDVQYCSKCGTKVEND